MPREKLAFHRNDVIRRYRSGESASAIGRHFGVTTTCVTTALKRAGVMPALTRGAHTRRTDEVRIITLFQQGVAPSDIVTQTGVSKSGLYAILRRAGVELRGHDGQIQTHEMRVARADAIERRGVGNEFEERIRAMLTNRGLNTRAQVAIGAQLVDIVLPDQSVAVEICCRGTFFKYVRDGWIVQRIRECAERGWHTYVLGFLNAPDVVDQSIDDVVLWAQFLDRAPPVRRQYRVVWGGFELLATGCSDDDQITLPESVHQTVHAPQRNRAD